MFTQKRLGVPNCVLSHKFVRKIKPLALKLPRVRVSCAVNVVLSFVLKANEADLAYSA